MKLVECVPNFSEGRNLDIIKSITDEIESVDGVKLLDVDPGKDTNRTVVTVVGTPDEVVEAVFKAIKRASELIDMSKHSGAHPRMGATDVCPFVPVKDITIEECNKLAEKLGERVGNELNIPIYLYEYSAKTEDRKNLANVRKGEYEALEEKFKDDYWKPDFGKPIFNAKSGATAIGVRDFLIAYNININSKDKKKAHDIAMSIREKGRAKRDSKGEIVRDENGKAIKVPGLLNYCKAIGWYIDDYGVAQISMNLTNATKTAPHQAFDIVCDEANKRGLRVTGSELVGLIPKESILEAGRYFLKKQNKSIGIPEKDIIFIAVKSMGLDELSPFDPMKKIIEYAYEGESKNKLVNMTIKDFNDELSTDSPAPGGGSVAALNGALAASLIAMVSNLTHGKKGYEDYFEDMVRIGDKAQNIKEQLLTIIDKDTDVFNVLMKAMKMPKKTDEQKKLRHNAMQEATKEATNIPFLTMETINEMMELIDEIAEKGNQNSISDAGVAAINAYAGAEGAYMNVIINLAGIEDNEFNEKIRASSKDLLDKINAKTKEINKKVYKVIL